MKKFVAYKCEHLTNEAEIAGDSSGTRESMGHFDGEDYQYKTDRLNNCFRLLHFHRDNLYSPFRGRIKVSSNLRLWGGYTSIQIRNRIQIKHLSPSLNSVIVSPWIGNDRFDGIMKMRRFACSISCCSNCSDFCVG